MESAEASIYFSPFTLLNRLVDSTHISSGIMQMRINVMELGRFTRQTATGNTHEAILDYPPAGFAKATRKRRGVFVLKEVPRANVEVPPQAETWLISAQLPRCDGQ